MDKINWCTGEKKGVKLTNPNLDLAQAYIIKSEEALKARVDSQYYTDRSIPDEQFDKMIKNAPAFLVKCKSILIKLNEKKINEIRDNFKKSIIQLSKTVKKK